MAANDLTTLPAVKQWLNITADTDDALLTRLITAASTFIESWLNRDIISQSYTETRSGKGTQILNFTNYPVTAVAALSIDGFPVLPSPGVNRGGYVFDDMQLYLYNHSFRRGMQNITFTYTAGYAVVPLDIEQACIQIVSLRYKEKDRIGQVSKSIGGEVVSFSQKDMDMATQTTLQQYKKVIPV